MNEVIENVVSGGAISFLIGGAAGYATKKILKLAILILGVFITAIAGLEYYGWLSVHWHVVKQGVLNGTRFVYHQGMGIEHHLAGALTTGTATAAVFGFGAGFLIGFKKG